MERFGIPVTFFPTSPSSYPRANLDAWFLRRCIFHKPSARRIVHARNSQSTQVALHAMGRQRSVPVIYDCRGAEPAECLQRLGPTQGSPSTSSEKLASESIDFARLPSGLKKVYQHACTAEKEAALGADAWTCVSQEMRHYLRQRYPESGAISAIQPCVTDVAPFREAIVKREETRRQYGLQDKLVFSYLGSLVWYQLPEAGLHWFRRVTERLPQAHLLTLTPEVDKFRSLARQCGVREEQLTLLSVKPHEVASLVCAADVGLLLRDNSVVNQVASPVKFAEYLASGVPVLISSQVGDYSTLVEQHAVGMVVDALDAGESRLPQVLKWLEQLPHDRQAIQQRCVAIAESQLDWTQTLPVRMELIQQLLVAVGEHGGPH